MNRIGLLAMLIALTGVGCLSQATRPFFREDQKPPAVRMQEQSPPPPVVSPDGITAENAAEKVRQLRREMEHEAKQRKESRTVPTKGKAD
jgi:hypothetical protein